MLRQGWNKSSPGQGSLGGMWSSTWEALPPRDWPGLEDSPDASCSGARAKTLQGSFRASSKLSRSPEQGVGWYLKVAIASTAWYRTAARSWSMGSFSSSFL